ncbi:MAG: hypothetical protein ABI634_16770 [Acidobacteriota bacterium]
MQLTLTRLEGRRNDLLLRLERSEIETALLSVANRDRLMRLPGMLRHREGTPAEVQGISDAKVPMTELLRQVGVVGADGRSARRAIAISNRNLGTNIGVVAWQRGETPRVFRVLDDPSDTPAYSCLTLWRSGGLSIEDLRFDFTHERVFDAFDGRDLSDDIDWATFGQRVLRDRALVGIDEIAGQFYDARHVLAFDHRREAGEAIRRGLYEGYPKSFASNVLRAWREQGVPRSRYFHNAIGFSSDALLVVQREGTVEEIGAALLAAGADDGIILDNGGSVACWAWWVNDYAGGLLSPTVDYRPPGTSAIAIMLKGPLNVAVPGGSVSYSTF